MLLPPTQVHDADLEANRSEVLRVPEERPRSSPIERNRAGVAHCAGIAYLS
jgi:hypothetical protein